MEENNVSYGWQAANKPSSTGVPRTNILHAILHTLELAMVSTMNSLHYIPLEFGSSGLAMSSEGARSPPFKAWSASLTIPWPSFSSPRQMDALCGYPPHTEKISSTATRSCFAHGTGSESTVSKKATPWTWACYGPRCRGPLDTEAHPLTSSS